ncbi:MAG: histidinol-phosphatase [Alphaproteobacteria bacterium]|nr:histidinol-phosphatase [Alphaproteobacteria bacterium]
MTDTDRLVRFAETLADAAGAAIRPYFRAGFDIEVKSDASPVTAADRAAEAAMRRLIEAAFPDHGIVGEEYGDHRADAEFVWVLDPIDGTRAFVAGRPLFGTLIGLLHEGRPAVGVIDQPIIGDRWVGDGRSAQFNGRACRVAPSKPLASARVGTTSPQAFDPANFARFERVRAAALDTLYGGDCHNYGLVASGHLDMVIEAGLKLHDWAALVPVIEGAGGIATGWDRTPGADSEGRIVAASCPALHAEALALLGCV